MEQTAKSLAPFLGVETGQTCWLFGKGGSLDCFDFSAAGDLRAAINDVAAVVPNCKYGFANDDTKPWADLYADFENPDFVLFQPWRVAITGTEPPCNRVVFADYCELPIARTPSPILNEGLTIGRGTISSVVQILYIMGVSKIICVGIDGDYSHASRAQWRTTLNNDHRRTYQEYRDWFIHGAIALGIEVEFWNEEPTKIKGGHMQIRVTKNTFFRGVSIEAGMTLILPEPEAREIIEARCAIAIAEEKAKGERLKAKGEEKEEKAKGERLKAKAESEQPPVAKKRARSRKAKPAA